MSIDLAQEAFDVMMRRGWHPEGDEFGWMACTRSRHSVDNLWLAQNPTLEPTLQRFWPDPFTALVEADKWYRENVEISGVTPPSHLKLSATPGSPTLAVPEKDG